MPVPTKSGTSAGLHHDAIVIPCSPNSEITKANDTELCDCGTIGFSFDIVSLHSGNDISKRRTSTITDEVFVFFLDGQCWIVRKVLWYVIPDPSLIDVASKVLREIH